MQFVALMMLAVVCDVFLPRIATWWRRRHGPKLRKDRERLRTASAARKWCRPAAASTTFRKSAASVGLTAAHERGAIAARMRRVPAAESASCSIVHVRLMPAPAAIFLQIGAELVWLF